MLVTMMLGACAAAPQVAQKRFFWPTEPDNPVLNGSQHIYGDLDIKEKIL